MPSDQWSEGMLRFFLCLGCAQPVPSFKRARLDCDPQSRAKKILRILHYACLAATLTRRSTLQRCFRTLAFKALTAPPVRKQTFKPRLCMAGYRPVASSGASGRCQRNRLQISPWHATRWGSADSLCSTCGNNGGGDQIRFTAPSRPLNNWYVQYLGRPIPENNTAPLFGNFLFFLLT